MEPKVIDQTHGKDWALYHGDCIPTLEGLPENSIDLSVTSPPFSNLYIYSDAEADMGNSAGMEEFLEQYQYMLERQFRATVPGRLTAVHVKDLPLYKNSSEWFGVEDFSGMVSWLHRRAGWIFHSRITIWKDPVIEMEKTNSHGLLHKNFAQRTQVCRTGLPDYLMVFVKPDPESMGKDVNQLRRPGDYIGTQPPAAHEYLGQTRQAPKWYPASSEDYNYSIAVWQRYASPVWFDIDQTRVLGVKGSKATEDVKHICPLQLDVIERAIQMWTNPGEIVFDPFMGIGSTGVSALNMGRKVIGTELKPEYFHQAVKNLTQAEILNNQPTLFDMTALNG